MAAEEKEAEVDENHPRHVFSFLNGDAQDEAFLQAWRGGRLHHAWLLTGPKGLGKATFAYRIARFLMGQNRPDQALVAGAGPLAVSETDTDARLIAAQAHPDFLALEREPGKKNIPVEAVRTIGEFFSKAPSRSAFRVCIIDAVDDLNINSANALLKILEEPPERGVLFLVSHSPGRLLATIRSRCRRLAFTPWSDEAMKRFLTPRIHTSGEDLKRLMQLANGSPGRAVALWEEGALAMDALAERILSMDPPPRAELMRYALEFKASGKNDGMKKFALFLECLSARVHALATAASSEAKSKALADLWSRLSSAASQAEAINLDRADYFWALLGDVRSVI